MMSGSDNYEPDISRLWWPPHQLDTHRVKPHPQSSEAGDRCGLAFTRYEKKISTRDIIEKTVISVKIK